MKYFTMDWWANRCDPPSVCDDYKHYIDSVRDSLPEQIVRFVDGHMLHDSVVRELSSGLATKRPGSSPTALT